MSNPIDYQSVLADLIAKRDKLNAAIGGIRAMLGGGDGEEEGGGVTNGDDAEPDTSRAPTQPRPARSGTAGTTIQSDTFFGLSTPEAIKKFLTMTKRPQRVADIAKAMVEGGQLHARDATTSYNNTYAAIKRMRKSGEAVRIKTGEWGLGAWYGPVKPPNRTKPNGGETADGDE